jgi:hypothetical protein
LTDPSLPGYAAKSEAALPGGPDFPIITIAGLSDQLLDALALLVAAQLPALAAAAPIEPAAVLGRIQPARARSDRRTTRDQGPVEARNPDGTATIRPEADRFPPRVQVKIDELARE